jgi:phospholipase/lecithinase/hemolysin
MQQSRSCHAVLTTNSGKIAPRTAHREVSQRRWRAACLTLLFGFFVVLLAPASSQAQLFNQVIVFGDSNVDSGFYRALPNPGGNATYNADWPTGVADGAGAPTSRPGLMNSELLAAYFGLTAIPANQPGGTNYATSGAKNVNTNNSQNGGFGQAIPTVTQIANYLAANNNQANANALYLIDSGGNDITFALGGTGTGPFPANPTQYVQQQAQGLATAIANLKAAGAVTFLVVNQPESFPTNNMQQQQLRAAYDQALFSGLAAAGVTFIKGDKNSVRVAFLNNPALYGFNSVSSAAGNVACSQPAGVSTAWALLCSSNPSAPSTFVSPNADLTQLFADDQHLATAGQEFVANYYYTLFTPPASSPLVAAVLPTSRSVQVGHAATVFATIVNSSGATVNGCQFWPISDVPGRFMFQTTNPATNQLSGTPNTPASIPAGKNQTFLLAFNPANAAYAPTNVQFVYVCTNTAAVVPIVGINTLLLTFSSTPVPDMIAVGLTPSGDGFSHTGGNQGIGVFAIASSNVGASGQLTAKVVLSQASMPLTATVCETNPDGSCMSTPSASVTTTISQNQNTTWSAFLQASGPITADPANNRVYFEFVDSSGVVRGSTSTAVTTQ